MRKNFNYHLQAHADTLQELKVPQAAPDPSLCKKAYLVVRLCLDAFTVDAIGCMTSGWLPCATPSYLAGRVVPS